MIPIVVGARDRLSVRRGIEIQCQVVTESEFRLVGVSARDVSTRGMLVISERHVEIGESLIVSMRLPRTNLWVDAEAVAVRQVFGRRTGDRVRGVGIHFTKLDTISRVMLATSLIGLPPPVPSRSIRKDYARSVWRIANDNGVVSFESLSLSLKAA